MADPASFGVSQVVPQVCLDRFNEAARLAGEGDIASALAQYEAVFADLGNQPSGVVTGPFLALVELRKAYCLMSLRNYAAAQAIFQSLDRGMAGQLETAEIFDFYLAYGNTLGHLSLLEEAIDRFAHAMNVATEYLRDAERFRTVWYWVLYWEKYHGAWEALDEHCADVNGFGLENQDPQLQIMALEFRCYADRALGRLAAARQGAEGILAWKQQTQVDPAEIAQWEAFLASLVQPD